MRRKLRWYHKLGAILLPVVLLLALVEIVLRVTGDDLTPPGEGHMVMRSENPRLIYEYRPDHTVTYGGVELRTNSSGFRDEEFSVPKPDGVFRIVALGDSLTFGYAVPVADAFPQQLERLLAGREPRIEVFNMGVAGYNTMQEIELLRSRALAYEPDLVVLGYVLNDDRDDADGGLARYFTQSALRIHDWLKIRASRIARKLGPDVRAAALEELARVAGDAGVPVAIVIFPEMQLGANGVYEKTRLHEQVRELCARHGFAVLDLLEPLKAAGFDGIRIDRVHPDATGYRIVAQQLRAFLDREGLIPPPNN